MITLEEYIKHEMSVARKVLSKKQYGLLKEAVSIIRASGDVDIRNVHDKDVKKYMQHIAWQIPISPITNSKNNFVRLSSNGNNTVYTHKRYPYMIKIESKEGKDQFIDTGRFRVVDVSNPDLSGMFLTGFVHPYLVHRDIGLIYRIANEIFPIKFPYKADFFEKKDTVYVENVGQNEFAILYHKEYLSDKMTRIMRAFRWNEKEHMHEEIPMIEYMKNKEDNNNDTAGETGIDQ